MVNKEKTFFFVSRIQKNLLISDCLNQKKCRARFGLEGQSQWCKHCRRKKKCTRFLEEDMSNHHHNNTNMHNNYHTSSMNTHGISVSSNGNPSSVSSPRTNRSDDDDEDDDDEHHTNDDDSDEENKQHHRHQQPVSLVYKPIPSKIESHQQQFQPPPPAHLYQPSTLPSHFAANFHY
jgi:hypothetical protein